MIFEGNGENEWLNRLAKTCLCCPECSDVPCGGCQQGAPCDKMPCRCDDIPERDEDEQDDYEDRDL